MGKALPLSEIIDELPMLAGTVVAVLGDVDNVTEAPDSTSDELVAAPLFVGEPKLVGVQTESVPETRREVSSAGEKVVDVKMRVVSLVRMVVARMLDVFDAAELDVGTDGPGLPGSLFDTTELLTSVYPG
jgi:hypothetical protein